MRIKNLELWSAFLVIAVITGLYLFTVINSEIPGASGFLGHSLGIIGFVLMLMTEILYSLRKRYMFARWGKLQHWLSFHIFTGLVGPFLVLLHSSWKFNGLAGILMLLSIIIVVSGFIGRYFYTRLPRSADGTILELDQLQQLIDDNKQKLENLKDSRPELIEKLEDLINIQSIGPLKLSGARWNWLKLRLNAPVSDHQSIKELRQFWERQLMLNRQLDSLLGERKLLAIWHAVHIPLGVATFTVAFIHIAATLYYATFAH